MMLALIMAGAMTDSDSNRVRDDNDNKRKLQYEC